MMQMTGGGDELDLNGKRALYWRQILRQFLSQPRIPTRYSDRIFFVKQNVVAHL